MCVCSSVAHPPYLAVNSSNVSSWCSARRRAEVLKLALAAEGAATRLGRTTAALAARGRDEATAGRKVVLARNRVQAAEGPRAAARSIVADIGGSCVEDRGGQRRRGEGQLGSCRCVGIDRAIGGRAGGREVRFCCGCVVCFFLSHAGISELWAPEALKLARPLPQLPTNQTPFII